MLLMGTISLSAQPKDPNLLPEGRSLIPRSAPSISCDRMAFLEDFFANYVEAGTSSSELGWTGNVEHCEAGTISAVTLDKTLQRVNYFRRLVGVEDHIRWDTSKNRKCQEAALMMKANNKLSHGPDTTWSCYTKDGALSAGRSNLSRGRLGSGAIPQYMADGGSHNSAVGHRRWIVYHRASTFGFGSTDVGTALWVIGDHGIPDSIPEFTAYPPPGYVPKALNYPRWSFSKHGADFRAANVRMWNERGDTVALRIEPLSQGFGDNSIVWVPDRAQTTAEINGTDVWMEVEVSNIGTSEGPRSYTYAVLLINPEYVAPMLEISHGAGTCRLVAEHGWRSIKWSNGAVDTDFITELEAGDYSVTVINKIGCEETFPFTVEPVTRVHDVGASALKVYPNPTRDKVFLEPENGLSVKGWQIVDQQGVRYLEGGRAFGRRTLDLGGLVEGIYFLIVQTDRGTVAKKVCKMAGR